MSSGSPIPLGQARDVAEDLCDRLAIACARIEIAGSIRRAKATVSDVELVAVPRLVTEPAGDLWGERTIERDLLAEHTAALAGSGELVPRRIVLHRADGRVEEARRTGPAYQALIYRGLPVDLFIVRPPAEWGVIFALRTGPGDWNTRLVTECQRYGRRVQGGRLLVGGQPVACPEEADFFRQLGQPWVDPWNRHPARVRLAAEVDR